jgi:hypothetical protein
MKKPLNSEKPLTWEDALLGSLDNMNAGFVGWVHHNDPKSKLTPRQTVYGFVRHHGQFYLPQPLPKRKGFRRLPQKECFFNCMDMFLQHGLTYVEGFAIEKTAGLVLHHAWCTDEKDVVYDFTWKKPGEAYFGVAFDANYVRKERLRQLADNDEVCLIRNEDKFYPFGPTKKWKHPGLLRSRESSNTVRKKTSRPSRKS